MNFTQDIDETIKVDLINRIKMTHRYAKLTFILVLLILIVNFTISGIFGYVIYENFDEMKHQVSDTMSAVDQTNEAIDIIKQLKK